MTIPKKTEMIGMDMGAFEAVLYNHE